MRLIQSRFSNFKKLRNVNISYSHPLTIFIGSNNSGKTTILEGIELAIRNSFESFNFLSKNSTLNVCYIELYFQIEKEDIEKLRENLKYEINN